MSFAEDVRHDSRTNPSTCQKIKYNNRSDTSGSCPTSDHRWSATQARLLAPHTELARDVTPGQSTPVSVDDALDHPAGCRGIAVPDDQQTRGTTARSTPTWRRSAEQSATPAKDHSVTHRSLGDTP